MNAVRPQKWKDLPTVGDLGGMARRAAYRSDEALLTFNWTGPGMPRWSPQSNAFDQIVITVHGTQIIEIGDEMLRCPAGSVVRVPANAMHTRWPEGDEEVLTVDVFAPPHADHLHLASHQTEYGLPDGHFKVGEKSLKAAPPDGKWMSDTSDILFRWSELPKTPIEGGKMMRAGFRGDHSLLSFNWIAAGTERMEPHNHPFDQLLLILEGTLALEVEGIRTDCPPESIVRIPSGAMHTGWVIGDEPVVNLDIFAPAREDYLYLTSYQKGYA